LPLTPLHFAIIKGDVATVKLLIEKGSDVNSKTSGGITPPHLVAVSGNADVAKLLLESGADANARDDMGRIPLHYASNASARAVSGSRASDAVTVVCPYCGRPAYRLGTLGRYYCFNYKRYV